MIVRSTVSLAVVDAVFNYLLIFYVGVDRRNDGGKLIILPLLSFEGQLE